MERLVLDGDLIILPELNNINNENIVFEWAIK
jgi:hypothetical protein